jgi:SnoaL-like domain
MSEKPHAPGTTPSAACAVAAIPILSSFRGYVSDFVNRHDFSAMTRFLAEDYTLRTGGIEIRGRDGPYRAAVARQLEQFPGLLYTIHEIHPAPNAVAVRFTEHGASVRHAGRCAMWTSIAIYRSSGGGLTGCSIEQDYFSRRRQLETGIALTVPAPAIAPWDVPERGPEEAAERAVRDWLLRGAWLKSEAVLVDDGRASPRSDPILGSERIDILDLMSSGSHVAFHAAQHGRPTGLLAPELSLSDSPAYLYLSGLVRVAAGRVAEGHIIRDRWGLYRRLAARGERA